MIDAGAISQGAVLHGMTQPAVSRSLTMLEERIGAPLVVKGRRPQQATPFRLQLAAHGGAILAESRLASDAAQGFSRGTRGGVQFRASPRCTTGPRGPR